MRTICAYTKQVANGRLAQADSRRSAHRPQPISVPQVMHAPPDYPYAGFWRRAAAYLLDTLLLGVASAVILGPATAPSARGTAGEAFITDAFWMLLVLLLTSLYPVLMECSPLQATVGKLATGLKVTDRAGERISLARSFGRTSAHVVTDFTLGIGLVMCAFTRYRQCLHDQMAGTLVVRRSYAPREIAAAGPAPPASPAMIALTIISVLVCGACLMGVLSGIAVPAYQAYVRQLCEQAPALLEGPGSPCTLPQH